MSYERPSDSAEFGGGGRGPDSYYNSSNDFEGRGGNAYGQQGGSEYNTGGGYGSGNNSGGGYGGGDQGYGGGSGNYGGSGGGYESNDWSGVQQHAEQHAGQSGDSSIFSNVLSHLQNNTGRIQQENIDEGQAVQAHQQIYSGQGASNHDSQTIGAGAAMQALKMFTGHGQSQGGGLGGGAHGGQNQFIGLAMAEASKLFDQQNSEGNVDASANKQSAVATAGEMAMKMYLRSQMGGGGSGLMGLANKFL